MKRANQLMAPQPQYRSSRPRSAAKSRITGITDFLQMHEKMAALLPAVTRLVALQQECSALFPALFDRCSVMQFGEGQLTLAAPNAALATKLRQQLPKLQENLLQRGWQVNAIRIKVQIGKISEQKVQQKQLALPAQAVSALASLHATLEETPQNHALKTALAAMLGRHRRSA